jgi:LacI family transcriptional regulator
MVKKQATIEDIANALNISASTVSRALNDHPKISIKTKEGVWEKAREMQYQPNIIASSLRKGKANTVGMIVPRINRHFFSNVINGVESILNPAGYNLIVCQTEEKIAKEITNIKTLISNRVSGILLSLSTETNDYKHLLKVISSNIPLVLFDRVTDRLNVSRVENDDETASFEMTSHLIEQGCRNIYWMGGPRSLSIYKNRFEGYTKALNAHGMITDIKKCLEGIPTLEEGYNMMLKLIAKNKLPDGLFCTSDYMAMGVIQACQERGISIPTQIAVAGYSNEPFAALISPKLTTVEQFSEEVGKAAAELMLEELLFEGAGFQPKKKVILPKIIIRESSLKT